MQRGQPRLGGRRRRARTRVRRPSEFGKWVPSAVGRRSRRSKNNHGEPSPSAARQPVGSRESSAELECLHDRREKPARNTFRYGGPDMETRKQRIVTIALAGLLLAGGGNVL